MNRVIIGLMIALCVVVGAGLFGILDSRATDVFLEATRPESALVWEARESVQTAPASVPAAVRVFQPSRPWAQALPPSAEG